MSGRASRAAKRDRTHAPKAYDAYFTVDPRPVPALLRHFKPRGSIWEPCAGRGDLGWALMTAGFTVSCTDLIDHGGAVVEHGYDFLKAETCSAETIITNPPNQRNVEITAHAIKLQERNAGAVAIYQRHEWDTNAERGRELFDHPAFAMKVACRFRPVWFADGGGENPFHRWSWYVWDWQSVGIDPIIKFS